MKRLLTFRTIALMVAACMILAFVLAAVPQGDDSVSGGDFDVNEENVPTEPGDADEPCDTDKPGDGENPVEPGEEDTDLDIGESAQTAELVGDFGVFSTPETWDGDLPPSVSDGTIIDVSQSASNRLEINGAITVTLNFDYTGRFNGYIDITDGANVIFNIEEGRTITTRGAITSAGMGKLTITGGGGTLAIANVFYYEGTGGIELMGSTRLNVVSGGDFNVTGLIKSNGGCITISGGTVTIGGRIESSDGDVNINGGRVEITETSNAAITAISIRINGGSGILQSTGTYAVVATSTSTLAVASNVVVREHDTSNLAEIHPAVPNMYFVRAGSTDPLSAVEFVTRSTPSSNRTSEIQGTPLETTATSPKMGDPGTGVLLTFMVMGSGGMTFAGIKAFNSWRKK
jgi:hypothetical protein